MKDFANKLINTLDNYSKSFSLRKVFALIILLTCYIVARYSFFIYVTNPYYLLLALALDGIIILLLLGLITFQQIIEFKKSSSGTIEQEKSIDEEINS
jgi:hypothetical protein